jgi:hypothetical protein
MKHIIACNVCAARILMEDAIASTHSGLTLCHTCAEQEDAYWEDEKGAKLVSCSECGDWHMDNDPTCPIVNGSIDQEGVDA